MKQGAVRAFLVLSAIGLLLIRFPCVPSVSAPFLITFKAVNVSVGSVFVVSLDLRVSAGATPSMLLPGGSGSLVVGVSGDAGNLSVTYLGNTYSKEFVTPIGSVKVPVYDVALGSLYVNVSGNVRSAPQVKGAADLSPKVYAWVSEGSQSVSFTHRVSAYSLFLPDVVTVEVPLEYALAVTVGVEALGSILFEYSKLVGSLVGSPTITQDTSTFPVGTFVVIAAAVVVAIRYWRIRRKRSKAAPKTQVKQ